MKAQVLLLVAGVEDITPHGFSAPEYLLSVQYSYAGGAQYDPCHRNSKVRLCHYFHESTERKV